jgi:hypothetical protein
MAALPAFADVRAGGFLAHRVHALFAHHIVRTSPKAAEVGALTESTSACAATDYRGDCAFSG